MRRKSNKYDTPDSGGWMHKADDLFLAQFRGRPCEICGATHGFYSGKTIRSMGHHLLSKELHRKYRYDKDNILTLCPKHHLGAELSPHSHDGAAQAAFYSWMEQNTPLRYGKMMERRHDKFRKEWKYRDMYVLLGGDITEGCALKDCKPKNHAKKIREAEEA